MNLYACNLVGSCKSLHDTMGLMMASFSVAANDSVFNLFLAYIILRVQ